MGGPGATSAGGSGHRAYELCVHASFCLSGIVQTIGMQWEDYHGLGGNSKRLLSRTTALPVLPTFAANLLAVGWLFQKHEGRRLFDRRMWWLVLFALIGEIANQASIILAGSLTFTVVYSSVTIFTACLGIPLLGSRPSRLQWLALATIVAGLLAAALSHTAQKGKRHTMQHYAAAGLNGTAHLVTGFAVPEGQEHLQEQSTADSSAFAFGAGFGMVGSLAYALVYVITELIQQPDDAPPPEVICCFVGIGGTTIVGTYIAVWDGPRWQGLVADELTASYAKIGSMYTLIVVAGEQLRFNAIAVRNKARRLVTAIVAVVYSLPLTGICVGCCWCCCYRIRAQSRVLSSLPIERTKGRREQGCAGSERVCRESHFFLRHRQAAVLDNWQGSSNGDDGGWGADVLRWQVLRKRWCEPGFRHACWLKQARCKQRHRGARTSPSV